MCAYSDVSEYHGTLIFTLRQYKAESASTTVLRNVGNYTLYDTASLPEDTKLQKIIK
jgi:hypothetical protein